MTSAREAMDFCSRWLPAWTGNRPEALIEFYAEDAFYLDPARPAGLRGREPLLAYFRKLLARNPRWEWRAVEVFPTEPGFVLKWQADVPGDRGSARLHGVDLVELREARIVRNEVYFDTAGLR